MVLATWNTLIKPISCKESIIVFRNKKNNLTTIRLADFSLLLISKIISINIHMRLVVPHVTYTKDKILVPALCTSIKCDSIVLLSRIGVFNIKIAIKYIYFPLMGEVSISWIQKSTDMKINYQ